MAARWELGILEGMYNGWELRQSVEAAVADDTRLAMYPSRPSGQSITFSELADMITSVYKDTENLDLPVGWVMQVSLAIWRGETTREAALPALRKFLGTLQAKKGTVFNQDLNAIPVILSVSKK